MIHVGDTSPAGSIQWQSHCVFRGRYAGLEIGVHGIVDVEVLAKQWVLAGIEEWRCVIGLRDP